MAVNLKWWSSDWLLLQEWAQTYNAFKSPPKRNNIYYCLIKNNVTLFNMNTLVLLSGWCWNMFFAADCHENQSKLGLLTQTILLCWRKLWRYTERCVSFVQSKDWQWIRRLNLRLSCVHGFQNWKHSLMSSRERTRSKYHKEFTMWLTFRFLAQKPCEKISLLTKITCQFKMNIRMHLKDFF